MRVSDERLATPIDAAIRRVLDADEALLAGGSNPAGRPLTERQRTRLERRIQRNRRALAREEGDGAPIS